jgi:hypothetical protein
VAGRRLSLRQETAGDGVIVANEELHGSENDRTEAARMSAISRIRSPQCRWV